MSWSIRLAERVLKSIKRISKKDAKRLFIVLNLLGENPYRGDIEKVEGEENLWRRRIGNYRIIYEVSTKEKIIFIFDLRRRTETTYKRK